MLNLLTAERIKVVRSKKLWIVFTILFLLPIYQLVNSYFSVHHYGDELKQVIDIVVNGASSILMMKKNAFTILLVISVFISFMIGEEFQNGTIRNALALGRSRTHYYMSKLITAFLITFIAVLGMTDIGMIGFSVIFGFGSINGISNFASYAFHTFGTLLILILANVSISVMIGFLTKNSSLAIIWNFLYTLGAGFIPGVFQHTEHFKQVTFWFAETFLFYFYFVVPEEIALYPKMILVSAITIVLSSALGLYIFQRSDIK